MYVVWACAWRGDLERARRVADETVRIATLLDDRMALALALSARAFVGAHAGGADAVREDADEALARFRQLGWQAGLIWPLWALGLLELSGGDPAAAYAALEPLAAVVAAMGTTDPVLCVFVPEAVQALVELGRVDEARALLEPFETQARALDRGWALAASARCRALLHAAGGERRPRRGARPSRRGAAPGAGANAARARSARAAAPPEAARPRRARRRRRGLRAGRRRPLGGAGAARARARRDPPRAGDADAHRRAHSPARRGGAEQPPDRRARLRRGRHGRGEPEARVPQAGHHLARPARAGARRAGRRADFVGSSGISGPGRRSYARPGGGRSELRRRVLLARRRRRRPRRARPTHPRGRRRGAGGPLPRLDPASRRRGRPLRVRRHGRRGPRGRRARARPVRADRARHARAPAMSAER